MYILGILSVMNSKKIYSVSFSKFIFITFKHDCRSLTAGAGWWRTPSSS